ncbi:helix-turn-helix domain-containing protein [Thermoactinomyces mirandus]|uniref:Helix-turn-helix transcriptional regulator n=1 Tax=Thermoactinomyces mirandus TaxID=2756294 RepID=A0A7W1XQY9_9BACL|nr:helix-turn-helix transcriptional regulator [Thermoactinomyces mirandus]MBA4601683.1 helix-turn-helix transcriptional regulator [Thermoactinomyces mirandus]
MNKDDLKAFGEALRKIRKKRGLRLKDLEDEHISFATISSIERGVPTVKPQNRLYYCQKLGYDVSQIPELIHRENETNNQIKILLFLIETCINLDCDGALERLRELQKQCKGQYMDVILYLKGLCYVKKNKLKRAEKYLLQSIQFIDEKNTSTESNIKSACLYELGKIYYFRDNDLNKALEYNNRGLKTFKPGNDRADIKYYLSIAKVSYLEKMYRTDEALQILNELWSEIQQIDSLEVKLSMYELKATLLNRKKGINQALSYAREGLYIARTNGTHERAVKLLTVWGNILQNANDYQSAENCYQLALRLENKLKDKKYLLVTTLTQLGKLYSKMERWQDAYESLSAAVARGKQYNDAHRYCESLMALGDYYLENNQFQYATSPYNEALKIANSYNFSRQKERILLNLSECWKKIGDKEKYIEILDQLQTQLRLRELDGIKA